MPRKTKKDILNLVYMLNYYGLEKEAVYWKNVVDINSYQTKRFSDKILKCSKCKSLCRKTFPDKWVLSPVYLAGGIVFLSELAGEYETKLMGGSVLLSLVFAFILSRFWINEKHTKNNLE